jgi:hypothetical protein
MHKDYITERLKFLTELFKLCWLSILGVGGGAISLLSGPFDRWRYGWASAAARFSCSYWRCCGTLTER